MHWTKIAFPIGGLLVMAISAGLLAARFNSADKTVFLPGETSHGHYQIELSCSACHDEGMGINEQSCVDCHDAELKAANDSHPKSKFTDPRNADRVAILDARNCVTCHREHQPKITRAMGVTMPMDYCYHCHQQTLKDRSSHKNFAFDSCATAGCHNYHDNSALYESFLVKHGSEPDFKDEPILPGRNLVAYLRENKPGSVRAALNIESADAPAVHRDSELLKSWSGTAHAKVGVNCSDCHTLENGAEWVSLPAHDSCAGCHAEETSGFLDGHHGMRLAQHLEPMTPGQARIPMKDTSSHEALSCSSCHQAHDFDTNFASMEACLKCHDDQHSLAYKTSPHFELWTEEADGNGVAGSGVSCATCHLPREVAISGGVRRVLVQHNQNLTLRPNEKMIRPVCMECHGLGFAIDALADAELIRNNFNGRPGVHIESIDLALKRQLELKKPKTTKE